MLLGAGAAAVALTGSLGLAGVVALGALWPLRARGDAALLRGALSMVGMLTLATLVLTPTWLHLLAGVAERAAFRTGLALAVRLDAVLLVGLALAAALPPVAWLAATRRFPRLGLVLTLTFRQVPELAAETERIRRAQRARGLASGPLVLRPVSVMVPVVVRSLERAERMGAALVLAGWTGGRGGTRVVVARWGGGDVLWALLGSGLLGWALLPLFNLG